MLFLTKINYITASKVDYQFCFYDLAMKTSKFYSTQRLSSGINTPSCTCYVIFL